MKKLPTKQLDYNIDEEVGAESEVQCQRVSQFAWDPGSILSTTEKKDKNILESGAKRQS